MMQQTSTLFHNQSWSTIAIPAGAELMITVVVALIACCAGSLVTWLTVRSNSATLEERCRMQEHDLLNARSQLDGKLALLAQANERVAGMQVELEQERKAAREKLELVTKASEELKNAFQALSSEALKTNNQSFLELARTQLGTFQQKAEVDLKAREDAVAKLVAPLAETLKSFDQQVRTIETARAAAYGELTTQVSALSVGQAGLQQETAKLVHALRAPQVRGRWGELQLRKCAEIAGMLNRCDFFEQSSVTTEEGRQRPDMVVHLPGGKQIIIDSKTPLQAYLDAQDAATEERRAELLAIHARHVREHMSDLSTKRYWDQFESTPDFVVLFLPGEVFFSAALQADPGLIDDGVQQKVLLASPTTLITLLRAIAFGWRQEQLAENAKHISDLGKRLYESLATMADHLKNLGTHLGRSVKTYNEAVGSMERNALVAGRRFLELGIGSASEIMELKQVEQAPRVLQSADWVFDEEQSSTDAKSETAKAAKA